MMEITSSSAPRALGAEDGIGKGIPISTILRHFWAGSTQPESKLASAFHEQMTVGQSYDVSNLNLYRKSFYDEVTE